jgi:hypothetical protein
MGKRVYWRCNGGDYISGERNCPWDGWSSPEIEELCAAVDAYAKEGKVPSIDDLRVARVSEKALQRAIVIDFGDDRAAFEALVPDQYLLNGKTLKMRHVPPELK